MSDAKMSFVWFLLVVVVVVCVHRVHCVCVKVWECASVVFGVCVRVSVCVVPMSGTMSE